MKQPLVHHLKTSCLTAYSFAAAGVVLLAFMSSANAAERVKPLHIQIPSIPENTPQNEAIDNNLPVYLLDAQMPATTEELKASAASPAEKSTGQVVIGGAPTPKTLKITSETNTENASGKPAIILSNKSKAAQKADGKPTEKRKPIAQKKLIPPSEASEAKLEQKPAIIPEAPQQAIAFSAAETTPVKSFLNNFSITKPALMSASIDQAPITSSAPVSSPVPDKLVTLTGEQDVATILSTPQQATISPAATSKEIAALPQPTIEAAAQSLPISSAPAKFVSAIAPPTPAPFLAMDSQAMLSNNTTTAHNYQTANTQTIEYDKNTEEAQELNAATASLSETLQPFNPFDADMSSLVAWAEQKVQESNNQQTDAPTMSGSLESTASNMAKEPMVVASNSQSATAQAMSSIAPAAGTSNLPVTTDSVISPPVRSSLVIEEIHQEPAQQVAVVAPKPITIASVDPSPTKPIISEPAVNIAPPLEQKTLSKSSERLLKNAPSKIDSPKKSANKRVDIERETKKTPVLSDLSADETASHEAMGVKIEVKKQALDVNYELERAYDALAAGNTDIAMASYERVLGNNPNNIQALFGMGALLHRAGDLDGARSYYGRVLARDPDHRDALNNLLSLVADEAPEEALAKLKALEARNPDFSPVPAQISYIYQKLGDISLAGQYMLKAIALAPNNLTYKYNLAILLDKQGAREDAAQFYQELVDAHLKGASIPGNMQSIQERLTFIRSNRK